MSLASSPVSTEMIIYIYIYALNYISLLRITAGQHSHGAPVYMMENVLIPMVEA